MYQNVIPKPTYDSSAEYIARGETGTQSSSTDRDETRNQNVSCQFYRQQEFSLRQVPITQVTQVTVTRNETEKRRSEFYNALSKFLELSLARVRYRSTSPSQTTLNLFESKLESDDSIARNSSNRVYFEKSRFLEERIYSFQHGWGLSENFQITLERLLELKDLDSDMEDEDEDEEYLPTEEAFSASITLLIELYQFLQDSYPLGYTSVDSRGGVNLIWKNKEMNKEVRLNVPASSRFSKQSVYYRKGSDSSFEENPSTERLAELLK